MQQGILVNDYAGASPPATSRHTKITDVRLVMTPPIEPSPLLKLHQWLYNTAKAHTKRITRSRSGDTVQFLTFERPVPLLRMLAALPYVAEVTVEEDQDRCGRRVTPQAAAQF